MAQVLHPKPSQVRAALVGLLQHLPDLSSDAAPVGLGAGEPLLHPAGPLTCQCGRYLSEGFNDRLFCRACEGYDPVDLTPRLAGFHRSRQPGASSEDPHGRHQGRAHAPSPVSSPQRGRGG